MDDNERIVELELRYLRQQDTIEQLSDELIQTNRTIELLEKRLARLEATVEGIATSVDRPANERPPHY
jgi:SlyX protein